MSTKKPQNPGIPRTQAAGLDRACGRNHHVCGQVASCGVRCLARRPAVLKLEAQARWFDGFASDLGPARRGHGLYKAEGRPSTRVERSITSYIDVCAGLDRKGLVGEAWRGFAKQPGFFLPRAGPVVDAIHATNATGRARELYTPAAAEVVASAYREDFAYLKYCATFECIQRGAFD